MTQSCGTHLLRRLTVTEAEKKNTHLLIRFPYPTRNILYPGAHVEEMCHSTGLAPDGPWIVSSLVELELKIVGEKGTSVARQVL